MLNRPKPIDAIHALKVVAGAGAELVEAKLRRDLRKWGTTVTIGNKRKTGVGCKGPDGSANVDLFGSGE